MTKPPSRVARELRAHALSSLLRRALSDSGASHSAVALALGVGRQRVDDYCDPECEAGLRAADIAALPPAVARDVLRSIADALGLAVVPLPAAVPMSSAKAAARLFRETGEACSEVCEAHADGAITPAEATRCAKELLDVIETAVTLREHIREALVVPVRRIGEAVRR